MKNISGNETTNRIRKLQVIMVVMFSLIIIVLTVTISSLTLNRTEYSLKSQVSSMTSALNIQMKINIDQFLSKMETTGTLIFAENVVYTYDASAEGLDEYEALSTEKEISDKLYSLCIMENYVDFGIVYRNNHVVGKISNGTSELFGDKLYADTEKMITRSRTNDGWFTGYNDNFKRIYYVKRVNENALLITSFYTSELQNVFENPYSVDKMVIRVADSNRNVIFSEEEYEQGFPLTADIRNRLGGESSAMYIDDDYIISINRCGEEWFVICSLPTEIELSQQKEIRFYTVIVAVIAACAAIILIIVFAIKLTNPVTSIVEGLNQKAALDLLTGLLNKKTFEELAEKTLASADANKYFTLVILDVDDFKDVNDTLGHSQGDKVLAAIGTKIREVFPNTACVGRLGGDEFGILFEIPYIEHNDRIPYTASKCEEMLTEFHSYYVGENADYKISASIGVSVCPDDAKDFASLYKAADEALYVSKGSGKDTYTIYGSRQTNKDGGKGGNNNA